MRRKIATSRRGAIGNEFISGIRDRTRRVISWKSYQRLAAIIHRHRNAMTIFVKRETSEKHLFNNDCSAGLNALTV